MMKTSKMTVVEFAEFVATHPVSGGKGDEVAKSTEASTAAFTKTLQQVFATNNAKQQGQLDFLTNELQSGVTNPQGYSPQTLASMRTQATEAGAQNSKNVMQAVNNKFATEGDATTLPSGVQEQIQSQAETAVANNEANAQLGITQQNGQLENENKWKAVQGEETVAGLENPEGMSSGANNGAGVVSNLSEAVTRANGPGVGSILGGIAGAAIEPIGSWLSKRNS